MNRNVQLGELLSLGRSSSADLQKWLAAASDFLAEADEASWVDLVSALRDARDPGAACVAKLTAFRVRMETAL